MWGNGKGKGRGNKRRGGRVVRYVKRCEERAKRRRTKSWVRRAKKQERVKAKRGAEGWWVEARDGSGKQEGLWYSERAKSQEENVLQGVKRSSSVSVRHKRKSNDATRLTNESSNDLHARRLPLLLAPLVFQPENSALVFHFEPEPKAVHESSRSRLGRWVEVSGGGLERVVAVEGRRRRNLEERRRSVERS